ncbi:MAG TPA: hypothetical protein VI456_13835 [Polyangia bacterium]
MKLLAAVALVGMVAAGSVARAAGGDPAGERISVTGYGYVVPDAPNYLMGVASADLAWLHLEGRYNYEALRTGSAFGGVNLGWGHRLQLDLTPMVGGVFGRLDGIAPALRFSLDWWRFDLWSESEVVIPFSDPGGGSFFYEWSELGFSPLPGIRVGGAIQRNLVFQTSLDVQRGLFAGLRLGPFNFTFYEFNWGWLSPTFVFALGLGF